MIHWEADIECPYCRGTGIYKGMAERGGAAVICYMCDGTGKRHVVYKYTEFEKRRERTDVTRVYKTSGGYVITDKDSITPEGRVVRFSEEGCTYEEWKNGIEPKPIRELHCPLIHYQQGTDKGEWLKQKGPCWNLNPSIPDCSKENREECWLRHDRGEFFN